MGWDGMGCSSSAIYPNFLFVAAARAEALNKLYLRIPNAHRLKFKLILVFIHKKKTNGSTTNFCTSSPLGARRLTLPVECVGENCVAKADGGGKDVDGRDAGAGHDRGLVPWGREKRAVTDNTQLQTRVEEEISFI